MLGTRLGDIRRKAYKLKVIKRGRHSADTTPWIARWRGRTICRAVSMEAALAGGLAWRKASAISRAEAQMQMTQMMRRVVQRFREAFPTIEQALAAAHEPGPIVAFPDLTDHVEPRAIYLIHDWEYEVEGKRRFAGYPEKAERLARAGFKLTPLYTRHER